MNETPRPSSQPNQSSAAVRRSTRFRLGALLAILATGGIAAWLALSGNDGTSTEQSTSAATEISADGLADLSASLNQPIYWIGPRENVKYELERKGNQILVGYVSSDQQIGKSDPHTVVGTYPISNAFGVTSRAAGEPDTVKIPVTGGAVAFYNKRYPLSAFISYPGSDFQIEVYDPKPGGARELISSGAVQPVPGSSGETPTNAEAVTPRELSARAAAAKQPIYWAGRPEKGGTLELTRTGSGWYLLRYLPPGAPVGDTTPRLTVGTYPVEDASAAVARIAEEDGAETLDAPKGALAVANPGKYPNSVFLAYPGTAYQIEVFAPTLDEAKEIVTSGEISAVG